MMTEINWVLEQAVLAIHRRQIAEHGGIDGVRDEGLLQSALMRPQNLLAYSDQPPDLAALAASYGYGITQNHPFIDGNKRVSLVVTRTFLLLNGYDLAATSEDKYITWLRLAEGSLSENDLTAWIRARLVSR